jgi:hypothetical protein
VNRGGAGSLERCHETILTAPALKPGIPPRASMPGHGFQVPARPCAGEAAGLG